MKNIHSIINVNNLLKKCITKIPGKENANLIDAYKMKIKFDKYTKNSHTNLHKATMLTKFIHRGDMKNSTYINKGGNKLYSSFSTSDVIKNIIEGKKKTGNCLGTSMACIYLLESNGIKTKLLNPDQHILISVKIENNYIPIETTITNGFNVIEKETRGEYSISKLESITLNAIFTAHQKKDDFKKTLKYIDESIKIDPNFSRSHYNKGCFLHKKK